MTEPNHAVAATQAVLEVIDRLEAAHGPLAFFQSTPTNTSAGGKPRFLIG
jgi:uncharacterized protein (DUF779 family)